MILYKIVVTIRVLSQKAVDKRITEERKKLKKINKASRRPTKFDKTSCESQ